MSPVKWRLDDSGRLIIVDRDRTERPDALSIFNHVFHGLQEIAGIFCSSLPEDIPGLRFSQIPAYPAVSIEAVNGVVCGFYGVVAGGSFKPLDCDVDQIIANREWFPIEIDALRSARKVAQALEVLGECINIGALVKLKTAHDLPFEVVGIDSISANDRFTSGERLQEVSGLRATLYPYQQNGLAFLRLIAKQKIGCILADEMGLGKTLQIIALLFLQLKDGHRPSLVVAPATLLENWRRECETFAPEMKVLVHAGGDRAGIAARFDQFDVVIASYDTAVRDEPLLSSIEWHIVVLDEAQAIKNPDALRAAAVKRIPREVSIAVSGTPLENRVDDLWSVTDFCLPGMLGTLNDFKRTFGDSVEDAARLSQLVAPVLLRRKVVEVADDLPEKIEIPQPIAIGQAMAEGYEALRKATIEEYGPAGSLVAVTRLRSFCSHPNLVERWSDDPALEMPKYQRLLEILEEVFATDEKALVFSTFQGMADIFVKDIPNRFAGGFFHAIDGRTPVGHRQRIVDEFFNHAGHGALFLNPKAAGSGLNITAANHVIHYNPEWNPALTAQASARAYRRKQTRPVVVHHLYFSSTVEEVIVERAAFKQMLAQNAVVGHDGGVSSSELARAVQISPF